ncbi:MAG: HlyD family efflux transporter periplasmic adaptor subunit [Desulfarculaceae bacterium]|nr:HlyD family efflux transporter periplasmic adaptor subunit [Desulfarculaceae bacterium]
MKKSVLFRSIRAVIVISCALGVAVFLVSVKSGPEKREVKEAAPLVEGMTVHKISRVMEVEAFGTVEPVKSVKISAEVPGRIDYINPSFEEGGKIREGETFVRIDQRSYRYDRNSAQVRVRQARADMRKLGQEIENLESDRVLARRNLKLSENEYERVKNLSKEKYASANSLDNAEKQKLAARMNLNDINNRLQLSDVLKAQKQNALDMALVDLEKAKLAFEKTKVKADFDACITQKTAEQGEFVAAGQVLGVAFEKNRYKVDVRIPIDKLKWLGPLQGSGDGPEAEVEISGPAGAEAGKYRAKLLRVKSSVDRETRTLPLTLEITPESVKKEKEPVAIRPGVFVKCRLAGITRDNIFEIPRYLVSRGNTLFLVKDGELEKIEVGILRHFEEKVYIDQGLEEGDIVLTTQVPGASDGQKVNLKMVGKHTAQGNGEG